MPDPDQMLLRANLRQLRLPTVAREFETLAREAADSNEPYQRYLLRLTEMELATRAANALQSRIKRAGFPQLKDFDTFDFHAVPQLNKQKILELARCEWIEQAANVCLIGTPGTGKTHLAIALGLAACRNAKRVRFTTAASLVNQLEEARQAYQLERVLGQLDRIDLLILDELGYLTFSASGAELLFQVLANRYERASVLVTSNLPFSQWVEVFQGERMTAALLDRLTHRCHIFETNGESYRFRESLNNSRTDTPEEPGDDHGK